MNRTLALLIIAFLPFFAFSQKKINTDNIKSLVVRYDPDVLRVPGNSLPIGISVVMKNGTFHSTKGYLNGDLRWLNFKIEVEGASFFSGNLRIEETEQSLKGNAIVLKIYSKKTKELLHEQEILYNYPIDLKLFPTNEFSLAPRNRITLGMDALYNNGTIITENIYGLAYPKNVHLSVSGGHYGLGAVNIEADPFKIENHTVSVTARSMQNVAASDNLTFILDYRHTYKKSYSVSDTEDGFSGANGSDGMSGADGQDGRSGSNGQDGYNGIELDVFVDVYFDTIINQELLYVEVKDLWSGDMDRFLVNTDGGKLFLYNEGGDAGDGGDGGKGGDGGLGAIGAWYEEYSIAENGEEIVTKYQGTGGDGGNGGYGGNGGHGGYGGQGGFATITYTKEAAWFQNMITIYNSGGDGGSSGSGGTGGSGGKGGAGNPSGRDGSSGNSGDSGNSGKWGPSGEVEVYILEE